MYFDAGFGNGFSISIFIWVQNFTMVQKLKNSKLQVKIVKSRVQNFAFLDTFGRFASPRPNALSQSHQILHTGWQVPGASSCKISAHKSNLSGFFGQKMPKNAQKMLEIWFFGYSSQIMSLNSMKFCVVRLDLDMKLQEKFHWLVISHFAKIQFWIFSKFWIFLLETVFKFFQPR